MKNIIATIILIGCVICFNPTQAQKSDFRIFGQITTVENKILKGYITWNGKMWWIDFFEASKKDNSYAAYFKDRHEILFRQGENHSLKPPVHAFICRFGNISKIRLIGTNTIELQVKDGNFIELKKGSTNDIGSSIRLFDGTTVSEIKWENISEVSFLEADSVFVASPEIPLTGIIRSNQGIYKGAISWNSKSTTANSEIIIWNSSEKISIPFRDIRQIERKKQTISIKVKSKNENKTQEWNNFSYSQGTMSANMPNIGSVSIPQSNFEMLEIVPLQSVDLLSYNDFKEPRRLSGEVETRDGRKVSGNIAYDLDEAMDFEILDGKNDNITYRIPFKYIQSVEPKNYKYSFITLRNGSTLSLGDSPDVNETNSGVIVFSSGQTPVYIPWKEIKQITFQ